VTFHSTSPSGRPARDDHSPDAQAASESGRGPACCVPPAQRAGPAPLPPAGTPAGRRVDLLFPCWGWPAVAYFAAVAGLLGLAHLLPAPAYLAVDAVAFAAGGSWCVVNFRRCRQAHCLLTGPGWLLLALFAAAEAGLGRSLIGGGEQLMFLAILAIGLGFEATWCLVHRTNTMTPARSGSASRIALGQQDRPAADRPTA
jgi:hypothetical protein